MCLSSIHIHISLCKQPELFITFAIFFGRTDKSWVLNAKKTSYMMLSSFVFLCSYVVDLFAYLPHCSQVMVCTSVGIMQYHNWSPSSAVWWWVRVQMALRRRHTSLFQPLLFIHGLHEPTIQRGSTYIFLSLYVYIQGLEPRYLLLLL